MTPCETTNPPQTVPPDDIIPNASGYTREQLAIRTLASVVSDLAVLLADDGERVSVWDVIADVFALTEPEGV